MVLKDWKLISKVRMNNRNEDNYSNQKNGDQLKVESVLVTKGGTREWNVELRDDDGIHGLTDRNFKTKSQAMIFARQYMRTH